MKVSDALFNPANMTVNVKNRKPEKKPVTNVAPVSKGDVTAEDFFIVGDGEFWKESEKNIDVCNNLK